MDNDGIFKFFVENSFTQKSVAFIKDNYKSLYGFKNKKCNTERLYPIRDNLREDYEFIYFKYVNNYKTSKKLEYNLTQNPEYIKHSILFNFDFDPEVPFTQTSNIINTQNLTNFIQPNSVEIKSGASSGSYIFNDNVYLQNSNILKDELNETRFEYRGNNYSNFIYNYCMNPVFSNDKNDNSNPYECVNIYQQLTQLVDQFKNKIDEITSVKSSYNDEKGFYNFFYDVMKEVIICRNKEFRDDTFKDEKELYRKDLESEYFNNSDYDNFVGFEKCFSKHIEKSVKFDSNIQPIDIVDTMYKNYMKIVPYILSPLYKQSLGNPAAHIFFMGLSIMCFKKLYKFANTECPQKENAIKCLKNILEINKNFILSNLVDKQNVELTELFDLIGPSFFMNILGNDVEIIISSLMDNDPKSTVGKLFNDSAKFKTISVYHDSSIAASGLVELFKKIENIDWFDSSIFEVSITNENKNQLHMFASALLEASLIYKNSLAMGIPENLTITNRNDNNFKYHKYSNGHAANKKMDFTCTLDFENNFRKREDSHKTDIETGLNDFSAINIMLSLANSIQICIDNFDFKDDILLTNSQTKRPLGFSKIWKEYVRQFLNFNDIYKLTDYDKTLDEIGVENQESAVKFLAAMDYGLQIKTWVYDSYYFWRSYRKLNITIQEKDMTKFWNLFVRYNDYNAPVLNDDKVFPLIIVPHVRGFVTYPLAGIYSYSVILGNLKKYCGIGKYDFLLSAYSRILMKDLYIFGDQEIFTEHEYETARNFEPHNEYPFVMRDAILQKCLNLFNASDYERILGSVYFKWYTYVINPILGTDTNLKKFIDESIPTSKYCDTDISTYNIGGMYNQIFGYEILWNLTSGNKNYNNLSLISHIICCARFMELKNTIIENSEKFNNYKYSNENLNIKNNILGLELLCMIKKSDNYNLNKLNNILQPMCESRLFSSIDDAYRICDGLPIYLFYKNGINILIEQIYTMENEKTLRHLMVSETNSCIHMTNMIIKNVQIIESQISDYGIEKFNKLNLVNKLKVINDFMENADMYNKYSDEDVSSIHDILNNTDLSRFYLNFCVCLSNFEMYSKSIIFSNILEWDIGQYKKFITENIPNFNKCITVRNKIVNLKNVNKVEIVNKIINDELVKSEGAEIKSEPVINYSNCTGTDRFFTPKWNKEYIEKLNNHEASTIDGKNLKQNYISLSKNLASQGYKFIFESFNDTNI